MKPCPKCGCEHQKLAFAVSPGRIALACYRCEWTGPFTPVGYPPFRQDHNRAADLWNAEATRLKLPAFLRRRLPVATDYVKPAVGERVH